MLWNSLVLRLSGAANLGILPTQVPRVLDLCFYCREIVAGRATFFERNAALQQGPRGHIRPAERRLGGYGGTRGRSDLRLAQHRDVPAEPRFSSLEVGPSRVIHQSARPARRRQPKVSVVGA